MYIFCGIFSRCCRKEKWKIKSVKSSDFTSFSLKFCNLNILREQRELSRNSWKPRRWMFFFLCVVENVEALFSNTRPGLVKLFFFLTQLSRYKIPIVCVWSLTLILTHASQQTRIVITEDWKILTPSNDPGSGNILITVSSLDTHQQDKLFGFQLHFIFM